jgi:hypothetical protein
VPFTISLKLGVNEIISHPDPLLFLASFAHLCVIVALGRRPGLTAGLFEVSLAFNPERDQTVNG